MGGWWEVASGGAGAVGAQAAGASFPRPTCRVSRPLFRPQRQRTQAVVPALLPLQIPEVERWAGVPPQHCPSGLRSEGSCGHPPSLCLQAFLRRSLALPLGGTTCLRCLPCSGSLLWGDIGLTPWAFPQVRPWGRSDAPEALSPGGFSPRRLTQQALPTAVSLVFLGSK